MVDEKVDAFRTIHKDERVMGGNVVCWTARRMAYSYVWSILG